METPETTAKLNDYAIRCFRDVADLDYILARMANRGRLVLQFHWSSQQCVEKYLKGILLFNRVKATESTHSVVSLLKKVKSIRSLAIHLSQQTQALVEFLEDYGVNRYLEYSHQGSGRQLAHLDQAVWEIRRYCKPRESRYYEAGNIGLLTNDGSPGQESKEVNPYLWFGGEIERILKDFQCAARPSLVWKNLYFSGRKRKKIHFNDWFQSVNAPLALHPEIFPELEKYVVMRNPVKREFQSLHVKPRKKP